MYYLARMSLHIDGILLLFILFASFALAADEDPFQGGELPENLGDTGPFEYVFPNVAAIAAAAAESFARRILRSESTRLLDNNQPAESGPSSAEPSPSQQPPPPPPPLLPAYVGYQAPAYPQETGLENPYGGVQQTFDDLPNVTGAGGLQTTTEFWAVNVTNVGDRAQPIVAGPSGTHWRPEYPQDQHPDYAGPPPILQQPPQPPPQWSTRATDGNGSPTYIDPLRCQHPHCIYVARTRGQLRQHRRYHIPEYLRPFGCPYESCTRRFNFPREVQRHLPVHRQLPRFYCPYTGCRAARRGFGREDHLTRHLRDIHGHST